jgi:hypothetical protein
VRPVREPVDDRLREPRIGEDLRPFPEGQVRGHDQRRALVALGDDLEDELQSVAFTIRFVAAPAILAALLSLIGRREAEAGIDCPDRLDVASAPSS